MAVGSDREGMKTGLNISGGPLKVNRYTQTSARKFFANDQVRNNDSQNLDVTSNIEHVVNQASGLKALGMVADSAAAQARDALAAARIAISQVRPGQPKEVSNPIASISSDDVGLARQVTVDGILSRLGVSGLESVPSRLTALAGSVMDNASNSFLVDRSQGHVIEPVNTIIPEMDYVAIEMQKKRGTSDCFFARLVFSVPTEQVLSSNIRAFRVFRSTTLNPVFVRDIGRLSIHAVDRMMAQPNSTRSKNQDHLSSFEIRLRESGIDNAVTALFPVDPILGQRTSADSSTQVVLPDPLAHQNQDGDARNQQDLQSFIYPDAFLGMDRSVVKDLNTLQNIQKSNPQLMTHSPPAGINVGSSIITDNMVGPAQLRQRGQLTRQGSPNLVVDQNNKQEFREIAFLAPEKLQRKIVGNYFEYTFDDDSVAFGRAYRYYVVTVDHNMHESPRSQFIDITVDGLRIPDPPDEASADILGNWVALTVSAADHLTEKFEIYRRESDPGIARARSATFQAASGGSGFTQERIRRVIGSNQFLQVGEVLNGIGRGGATFYDRSTIVGRRYEYRIYAVDIFGNKSEAPKEISIFVPDPVHKHVELQKPTLLAEVDAKTDQMRLTYGSDDPRIKTLILTRRDVTINQSAFVAPGSVSFIRHGRADARGSSRFLDVRLADTSTDTAWNGNFKNDLQEHVFIDVATQIEHSYQYKLVGIDRFGNASPAEITTPVFIVARPFIDSPVSLRSSVVTATDGNISGVRLDWNDSNVSVSAEELVGPQISAGGVADTSVRTLFQLERRKLGEDSWKQFQLVSGTSYFDPAAAPGRLAPSYLPPLLEMNENYIYRVQAFQTGGFISNFSSPIQIFIGSAVLAPENFRLRASDTKIRPLYSMLNWDTNDTSGVVDYWEMERAVVNNYAAARLNFRNPDDFSKLNYYPFKKVYLESNRFQSTISSLNVDLRVDPAGPITGQNCFMDMSVQLGNSYFYRIRAISVDGKQSSWTYRGIKMSDDIFDHKLDSLLTNDERVLLSTNFDSVALKMDFLLPKLEMLQSSFGFHPNGEKSSKPPSVAMPSPSVFLSFRSTPTHAPTLVKTNQPSPYVSGRINSPVLDKSSLEASYQSFDLSTYADVKGSG